MTVGVGIIVGVAECEVVEVAGKNGLVGSGAVVIVLTGATAGAQALKRRKRSRKTEEVILIFFALASKQNDVFCLPNQKT